MVHSHGVLNFTAVGDHASGDVDQRAIDGRQVAAAARERAREPLDDAGRRIVGDEVAGQLVADVLRGRGRVGEVVQDRERLLFAGLVVAPAHDGARAGLVQRRAKHEACRARAFCARLRRPRCPAAGLPPRLQPVSARANSVTSSWL